MEKSEIEREKETFLEQVADFTEVTPEEANQLLEVKD